MEQRFKGSVPERRKPHLKSVVWVMWVRTVQRGRRVCQSRVGRPWLVLGTTESLVMAGEKVVREIGSDTKSGERSRWTFYMPR